MYNKAIGRYFVCLVSKLFKSALCSFGEDIFIRRKTDLN